MSADVIVVGLGGNGSAAAASLARRGARVLGFERYRPAHDRGSSHGQTRAIRRQPYVTNDPAYALLLREADELWKRLEGETDRELLTVTGALTIAPRTAEAVTASLAAATANDVSLEILDAAEVASRWPTMTPGEGDVAFYEPGAGIIRPEAAVAANHELATAHGADLRFATEVQRWEATDRGVEVWTSGGRHQADHLIVAAGAWTPTLLADLELPLVVERRLQVWLRPTAQAADFALGRHPIFVWQDGTGAETYGFPMMPGDDGVKAAFYRDVGASTLPDALERGILPGEVEDLTAFLADRMPALSSASSSRAAACMYTVTPDEDFLVGPHPAHPNVTIGSACSGHGFKFVPVMGEVLADLAVDGQTARPIGAFDPRRFTRANEGAR